MISRAWEMIKTDYCSVLYCAVLYCTADQKRASDKTRQDLGLALVLVEATGLHQADPSTRNGTKLVIRSNEAAKDVPRTGSSRDASQSVGWQLGVESSFELAEAVMKRRKKKKKKRGKTQVTRHREKCIKCNR